MDITYLFDPLCGWCYGASRALEQLARRDGVNLELAPTGLFAGEGARAMDASFAAYAWQNDQRIARLSDEPFSDAYRQQVLGATGSIFDSAPATLAIVAVGLSAPRKEIAALKALQQARYVDGMNNSDLDVVARTLAKAGLADAAERVRAPDDELMAAYRSRIGAARTLMAEFRVNGVPALVVSREGHRRLLPSSALFGGFEALVSQLETA